MNHVERVAVLSCRPHFRSLNPIGPPSVCKEDSSPLRRHVDPERHTYSINMEDPAPMAGPALN